MIKTEKADFKLKEDLGILGGHLWRTNLKRHSKNLELKQQNS